MKIIAMTGEEAAKLAAGMAVGQVIHALREMWINAPANEILDFVIEIIDKDLREMEDRHRELYLIVRSLCVLGKAINDTYDRGLGKAKAAQEAFVERQRAERDAGVEESEPDDALLDIMKAVWQTWSQEGAQDESPN
jgi:hypothetical protein